VNAEPVLICAVILFTLIAAIYDMFTMRIPNWITVPAFVAALVYHSWFPGGAGLLASLGGFATGFGILMVLWLIGGGGAGDVKLMGALGAWLAVDRTLYVFMASAFLIVLGAIAVLTVQLLRHGGGYVINRYLRGPNPATKKPKTLTEEDYRRYRQRRRIMPFGLPVALGTWLVLAWPFLRGIS